jgi:D-alanyl-D-alanine carboxypeptidase
MPRPFSWLTIAACLACGPALAAGTWGPAKKLDQYFDLLATSQRVSAAVAVSEKGTLRYERVIGFATIDKGVPQAADAGTRYRIGAVSSIFTAALVLQLAEKASITLDTPVAEFFPDVPNAIRITYRDLLAQRSGLADYARSPDYLAWRTAPRTSADMLQVITAAGTVFEPRARIEYSASNYLLLGYVLEKIHERPYADLVRRQIVEKLGLARTYQAGAGRTSTLEAAAYLPSPQGWIVQAQTDPSVAGGASGLFSNAVDLVRFMDALLAGKLVSEQSIASMRGEENEPGLGFAARHVADQAGFGRSDSAEGFGAAVYHFPARGLSIACTSNASELPFDEVVAEILNALLVRGYRPPAKL